ncbi:MAG TPA: pentapeptide repeat-containing protein [Microcoleaceae cyanobacterium]|jgi:uncharacterized protein YjbI with pentapeptide repeats
MEVRDLIERYQNGERDFSYVDLSGANLSGVNLRDADLTGANLTEANLSWAFLNRANLTSVCLRRADLHSASFSSANLQQATLSGANLAKIDLRLARLRGADLNWAVLSEADLSGADLQGAKLDRVNLERAKLNSACLVGTELMEVNLRRSNLASAKLDQANLREAHLEEANLREATLIGANLTEANLSGAYLRQANLTEADLHRVVLTGADLSEAIISNADLSRANLAGAYLLKTSFRKAHLLRTNLQDVYLLRADLSEANLRGADLRRADLSGAYLCDATLSDADLSDAYLLESHLIRTNLDGAQMTGCCIYNWHTEDLDLSKVNCHYIYTHFDHSAKKPTDRYPIDRDLEPGELGRRTDQNSAIVEVYFTEPPNWETLAFTLAQIELESEDLHLTVRAYDTVEDNYLLKLAANRLVNAKALSRRIFQLYPEIQQRFLARRPDILKLIGITQHSDHPDPTLEPPPKTTLPDPQAPAIADRQSRLYREVVRQIQHILNSQVPDQFVESVQRLLDFLKGQGISTREIQKRLIGQAILQRAKLDEGFREQLIRWEKTASEEERLSTVGHAVRMAIAMLWNQFL